MHTRFGQFGRYLFSLLQNLFKLLAVAWHLLCKFFQFYQHGPQFVGTSYHVTRKWAIAIDQTTEHALSRPNLRTRSSQIGNRATCSLTDRRQLSYQRTELPTQLGRIAENHINALQITRQSRRKLPRDLGNDLQSSQQSAFWFPQFLGDGFDIRQDGRDLNQLFLSLPQQCVQIRRT